MINNLIMCDNVERRIENTFIRKVLEIYDEKYQFLKSATISNEGIVATINVDTYPYTTKHLFSYVTAPSISLVVGQVCYVFVGEIIRSKLFNQLKDIDLQKYFYLRDRGDLVFTNIDYKFKRKIPENEAFSMSIQVHSVKRMNSLAIAKFEFEVTSFLYGKASLVANLG